MSETQDIFLRAHTVVVDPEKSKKGKGSAGDAISGAALRSGQNMPSSSTAKLAPIPAKA